jgi:hypothetical protein
MINGAAKDEMIKLPSIKQCVQLPILCIPRRVYVSCFNALLQMPLLQELQTFVLLMCRTHNAVQLVRFCGRPTDLTPKARFRTLLGYVTNLRAGMYSVTSSLVIVSTS